MSRSRVLVVSLASLFFALAARSQTAPSTPVVQAPPRFDGFGTLDYARGRSLIKVGSWVKYHMSAKSEKGVIEDYTSTVLIGGEDDSWGEECFWVETQTRGSGGAMMATATLVSYAIFDDSLPAKNYKFYQRRRVVDFTEDGQPRQTLLLRYEDELRSRPKPESEMTTLVDTLGTETVKTARGDFVCLKVRTERGLGANSQSADSTQYNETRIVRVTYMTPQVPVRGFARQDIEWTMSRRTWLTGRSKESNPQMVMDHSKGALELVDFGTGGLEAVAVPVECRRTLAEQHATRASKPRPPAAKPRPLTR